jgi:C4-dicarboxylate-specific signal transduction histidine kinase
MTTHDDARQGLRWLAQLRWSALVGASVGVVIAKVLEWRFVSTEAVLVGIFVMALVNLGLEYRARRGVDVTMRELSLHAAVDLLLLTWLLAWTGGLKNPLSMAYSFHVVLGALLNGRRGVLTATSLSLACVALLYGLEHTNNLPMPALHDAPFMLWMLAIGMLLVGLGYLALVAAERQRRSVTLLLESLAALKVGLDLKGPDGSTQLANETAIALEQHNAARDAVRDVEKAGGSRRLAVPSPEGKGERIIDLVALPPHPALAARALLFVDRTDELLVEQRHVMLERLATLGRAMQGVAHELNTPLTTMQTLAKDLRAALADAPLDERMRIDVEESLQLLVDESQRCRTLTQALLTSANDGTRKSSASEQTLLDVARRAVRVVGTSVESGDVGLDENSLDVPCPGDADRVLQVLMNLVQNALRATIDLRGDGKGPRCSVRAERIDKSIKVIIQDRGPGLPAEVRERLFEPFVTTRPMGEGTGLGLYTSQIVARELGGTLTLDDARGGGTIATLTLPR